MICSTSCGVSWATYCQIPLLQHVPVPISMCQIRRNIKELCVKTNDCCSSNGSCLRFVRHYEKRTHEKVFITNENRQLWWENVGFSSLTSLEMKSSNGLLLCSKTEFEKDFFDAGIWRTSNIAKSANEQHQVPAYCIICLSIELSFARTDPGHENDVHPWFLEYATHNARLRAYSKALRTRKSDGKSTILRRTVGFIREKQRYERSQKAFSLSVVTPFWVML